MARVWRTFVLALVLALSVTIPVSASPVLGTRPLQEGLQGDDVKELQRLLTEAGQYKGPLTGYFGALTRAAVQSFQRRQGLPNQGYFGPLTFRALQEAAKKGEPKYHTVKPGESLWLIAKEYGVSLDELKTWNQFQNPELLVSGQKLVVKPSSQPAKPVSPPKPPEPPKTQAPIVTPAAPQADPLRLYQPKEDPARQAAATARKTLALTFDDGPDPSLTPKILDLLQKYKFRATFFVVGQKAEKNLTLVKRMIQEGHEVGNHSYSHRDLTELTPQALVEDMERASALIRQVAGSPPVWFRPPGGNFDDRLVDAANKAGQKMALWTNIGPQNLSAPILVRRTLSAAREGAVLMLHDTQPQTLEALEEILASLARAGYQSVTLSELAGRQ